MFTILRFVRKLSKVQRSTLLLLFYEFVEINNDHLVSFMAECEKNIIKAISMGTNVMVTAINKLENYFLKLIVIKNNYFENIN